MQPICTHTISVQSSKPSHAYPIIRLPREFRDLAGSQGEIYQTAHQGKLAFLVTVDKPVDNCCLLGPRTDTELRLQALESEIKQLKSLLFDYKAEKGAKFIKERKQKAEGEIRTRVVASTVPYFEYRPQNGLIFG
jgi:hypothetical protein